MQSIGAGLNSATLFGPEVVRDPFPLYHELRPGTPFATDDDLWLVMKNEQVFSVLADHRTFSSKLLHLDNPVLRETPILFEDPPDHTRHRKLLQPAFTPARIDALEPWVADVVDGVVSSVPVGEVEAVAAFCDPLPVRVIAHLMGVPAELHAQFKTWSDQRTYLVARRTWPEAGEEALRIEEAERGNRQLLDYFVEQAGRRRAEPLDDLLADVVAANVGDDALGDGEIAAICALLLTAGNVTTTNLLSNMLSLLADHPDVYERLRADRSLVDGAVEEVLRLESPVQWLYRRATREARVGDAVIPAGASVIVYFGAANRDPAVYAEPDRFLVDRPPSRHAAFGHGVHFCLGTPLARLEATLALNALLDRFSALSRGSAPPVRIGDAATHCGHRALPIVFHH
jgi:cytochrome P450